MDYNIPNITTLMLSNISLGKVYESYNTVRKNNETFNI